MWLIPVEGCRELSGRDPDDPETERYRAEDGDGEEEVRSFASGLRNTKR